MLHPNRKPYWPAPGELRASPFRGRLRSTRYARLRSAAPGRGAQIAKNPITEQTLHRPEEDIDELKIYQLRALADQGDAVAQHNLGVCYYFGKGVPKDMALAKDCFLRAAAQGFDSAQPKEGSYVHEKDVPMDSAELVNWCREEAKQGNAAAQYRLGNLYFEGIDISQNHAKAVKWYRRAAEQGYPNAQINLGYCYANGKGIAKNEVKAAKWYRKAAMQGDAAAQEILSHCSSYDEGVTKDELKGVKWFRKANE